MGGATCIVCKKSVKKSDGYIHYDICSMKPNKEPYPIGKMDIHRTQDCYIRGSTILRNQCENCVDFSHIGVTAFLTGKKYFYNMAFISNHFDLVTNWGENRDNHMYNIFEKCIKKEITFGALKYFSNTLEPSVPILLSTTNDPIFPPELLNDADYLQRVKKAEEKLKQNIQIKRDKEVERMYTLYNYIMETVIML